MFSTKRWKILLIIYLAVSGGCFLSAMYFGAMGQNFGSFLILGAIAFLLSIPLFLLHRYDEKKGALIQVGYKLLYQELKPAEFIKEYELLKGSDHPVAKNPRVVTLQLVVVAYDVLNEKEKALEIVNEMAAIAPEKKRAYVNLLKVSLLYDCGRTEEADKLFEETHELKLDIMAKALSDGIINAERAIAKGDYKLAELYYLKSLECTFPKPDNLSKLIFHYELAKLYEKMQENEKAIPHYQYCAENGGQTAMRESAKLALERLAAL